MPKEIKVADLYEGRLHIKRDHRHVYRGTFDGQGTAPDITTPTWMPGVTSIAGMLDNGKSIGLQRWGVSQALNVVAQTIRPGVGLDEVAIMSLLEEARKAPYLGVKSAGSYGTLVHDFVERWAAWKLGEGRKPGAAVSTVIRESVKAFEEWAERYAQTVHAAEKMVASLQHWYVGTLDLVVEGESGVLLVDLKTSRYVSTAHMIQTAAYQAAFEEEFDNPIQDRVIVHLSRETGELKDYWLKALVGTEIVQSPYMKPPVVTYEDDLKMFLALRQIHSILKGS